MSRKFIITVLGGGQGYTLKDTDLWGLECAVEHGLQDGYLNDNKEWAEAMLERIRRLRTPPGEYVPGPTELGSPAEPDEP